MGTRGFITFVADGVEKTGYNQHDSYPSYLGANVLEWLHPAVADLDALHKQVVDLRVVSRDDEPTAEDLQRLAGYADLGVSERDPREWYVLLRETQGRPDLILQAGVIEDAADFPLDSLFAEWGYVVDLDRKVFEVYQGFQDQPHARGRFASHGRLHNGALRHGYYPVALVKSWPLDALPTVEQFEAAFGGDDE